MDDIEWMIGLFELNREAIEKLKKGGAVEGVCPMCGGTLQIYRSGYNGHLHITCETCRMSIHQ